MTAFWFKAILVVFFLAAVVALSSGFFFLLKDRGERKRVAYALLIRVILCAVLVVLLIYGYYAGYIGLTSPVGLAPQ